MSPSAQQDAAIDRILPQVSKHGWTLQALQAGSLVWAADEPMRTEDLFPGGGPDMIEAFCDLADRRMLVAAQALCGSLRPSQRLRQSLALRLAQNRPHREAVRRAVATLALRGQAARAARCTYRTIDALWAASGDRSTDVAWYTKRASLAVIYTATLAFWFQDDDEGNANTLAFFDRQVMGLRALSRWRTRITRPG